MKFNKESDIHIRLYPSQRKKLDTYCKAYDITASQLFRRVVELLVCKLGADTTQSTTSHNSLGPMVDQE